MKSPFQKKLSVNCNLIFTACLRSCVAMCIHRAAKIWIAPCAHFQPRIEWILFCLLLSSFIPQTSVLFVVFSTMYLHFLLVVLLLKCSQNLVLRCYLVFLSTRRLSYTLWKKYLDKFCSGMSYSAIWPLAHC